MSQRLVAAVLAIVVAGCVQAAAEPLLENPREILVRTVAAGLELQSAAVGLEMESTNPGMAAQTFTAEGLVDFDAGEAGFSGRGSDGLGAGTMVIAGGNTYVQSNGGPRWQMMPNAAGIGGLGMGLFGAGGDPPDVSAALLGTLSDPTTSVELKGVEDCEGGGCYRTTIAVAPERAWKLLLDLSGMGSQPGVPAADQPPGEVPRLDVEILSSTSSFLPIEMSLAADSNGTRVAVRAILSRHNEEVSIQAPPENLVDRWDEGFDAVPPDDFEVVSPAPDFPDGL